MSTPANPVSDGRNAQLAARYASNCQKASKYAVKCDSTVRKVILDIPGGYLLYGHATQIYYQTRWTDANGAVVSGESAAPSANAEFATPAVGSPSSGNAITGSTAKITDGTAKSALALPTDPEAYREIAVPQGSTVTLYVCTGNGGTDVTTFLEGPFL